LDNKSSKYKEKRANLFKIILEINSISTRLLLMIIPKIGEQLKDEEYENRNAITQLLGNMFSSKESTFYYDYTSIFGEFLGRFADVDSKIRSYMVQFSALMLQNHPDSSKKINGKIKFKQELLNERVLDPDEKVRRNVVETVCTVSLKNSHLIDETLIKSVGDRMRDKKDSLREITIELLLKLYKNKLSENIKKNKYWSEDDKQKFSWIPDKIFNIYSDFNNFPLKQRYSILN
jgi:sister chromatid cohesion protein PDS5